MGYGTQDPCVPGQWSAQSHAMLFKDDGEEGHQRKEYFIFLSWQAFPTLWKLLERIFKWIYTCSKQKLRRKNNLTWTSWVDFFDIIIHFTWLVKNIDMSEVGPVPYQPWQTKEMCTQCSGPKANTTGCASPIKYFICYGFISYYSFTNDFPIRVPLLPIFSPLNRDQAVFSSLPFPSRGSSIVTRMQRCGGERLKEWGLCFPLLGIEFGAFHSLGCVLLPSNTLAPHSRLDNGTPFHKYIIT